jgi:hypothetical protein
VAIIAATQRPRTMKTDRTPAVLGAWKRGQPCAAPTTIEPIDRRQQHASAADESGCFTLSTKRPPSPFFPRHRQTKHRDKHHHQTPHSSKRNETHPHRSRHGARRCYPPLLSLSLHSFDTAAPMFNLPSLSLHIHLSWPQLNLGRRLQRGVIRVILAALFIARAEIRAINVQGMLLSWFRFCPEFRDQATTGKSDWSTNQRGCYQGAGMRC